jgi:hypothetical protein
MDLTEEPDRVKEWPGPPGEVWTGPATRETHNVTRTHIGGDASQMAN